MDDPSRGRRQYEPPGQRPSNQRYQVPITSPQGTSFSGERYRPPTLNTSPPTPRSINVAGNYNSYYQESQAATFSTPNMSATAMAYGADYGSDTRGQGQSFGNYNAGMMMYNVPQSGTQTPVYDTQTFTQRQPAAMPIMAPDVVASTYFGSEPGAAAASMQQTTTPQGSAAPSAEYHHAQGAHMGYAGNINAMQQQAPAEGQDYRDAALEQKWVSYQRRLGTVFQDVKNGSLESASETLLSLSNWLLTQVADLGLSQDDASLHDERIKLWNDFNHAWLALGFQQKQLMQTGQQVSRAQTLMSESTIKKMGDELVRLCDGVERHGLVDYQYGVWEEQIESSKYLLRQGLGEEDENEEANART
ncbi:hypothetical protein L249_4530 [Ophiocordyceps polyrhachis-furcata BCC 54312]|uniref:Uncharacterized protein n=1 Tax=Ophiocordyceps polyrhachis-furcata BCC 54312 TaxID=1330021 RepID=A0A367KZ93_9HYPO|nr:hypothetical protein L249_4530 [Ophiocordyceps polyrhachis-furcata BCC 54312]